MSEQLFPPMQVPQASPGAVQKFYIDAMGQLDEHALRGEQEAKIGATLAMITGLNVVYFGDPGGGKTTLGEAMPRLVSGIEKDDIATIPPQSDLTAQALAGGQATVGRVTTTGEGESRDTLTTEIDALLRPNTKVIWANEINRIPPHTLNVALEAFESGVVDRVGGRTYLDGLLWSASTMNPGERRDGTFEVTAALASRHAIGALMGNGGSEEQHARAKAILSGWEPQLDAIEPIITIDGLRAIQTYVRTLGSISYPEHLQDATVYAVARAKQTLEQQGRIAESDARLAKHVRQLSIGMAALRGERAVEVNDIRWGLRFAVGARAGMLARNSHAGIDLVNAATQF